MLSKIKKNKFGPGQSRRNSQLARASNKKKKIFRFSFFKTIIFLAFASLIILFIYTRYKAFQDPISVLSRLENGDLAILVYNPKSRELNTFIIDQNTQVVLSRSLGKMRIKGVWQLSQNEGLGEKLLLETVVKNFKLPISNWVNGNILNLISSNPLVSLKTLILPTSSNLSSYQKIKLFQIGLFLPASKNNFIDLKDTQYLNDSILEDGENGFTVSDKVPNSIAILFLNSEFSKKPANIAIINKSGNIQIENVIAEIFGVYGVNLVSVSREAGREKDDCTFYLNNINEFEPFIDVFGCDIKSNDSYKSVDIVVEIGDKFVERF